MRSSPRWVALGRRIAPFGNTANPGYHRIMLSTKTIDAYRAMTVEERWRIVEELMTLAWRALKQLPEDERERRLAVVRKQLHEGNELIWE